jgi:hypothetical protein
MWKVTSLSNALIAKTLEGGLIRACGAQRRNTRKEWARDTPRT